LFLLLSLLLPLLLLVGSFFLLSSFAEGGGSASVVAVAFVFVFAFAFALLVHSDPEQGRMGKNPHFAIAFAFAKRPPPCRRPGPGQGGASPKNEASDLLFLFFSHFLPKNRMSSLKTN
jgi:hypothetical protein